MGKAVTAEMSYSYEAYSYLTVGQYVLCVKSACVCVGGGEGEDWGETAETTQYYMYSNQW